MKLTPAWQLSVRNSYAELHEYLATGLVSDIRSQTQTRGYNLHTNFFLNKTPRNDTGWDDQMPASRQPKCEVNMHPLACVIIN